MYIFIYVYTCIFYSNVSDNSVNSVVLNKKTSSDKSSNMHEKINFRVTWKDRGIDFFAYNLRMERHTVLKLTWLSAKCQYL